MNQPEEQHHNEEKFDQLLATVAPELWTIQQALKLNNVDPKIIPFVIEAIGQVGEITGHGEIRIYFVNGEITNIEPLTRMKVNIRAILR